MGGASDDDAIARIARAEPQAQLGPFWSRLEVRPAGRAGPSEGSGDHAAGAAGKPTRRAATTMKRKTFRSEVCSHCDVRR